MHILFVFVASLGGERKKMVNGLQPSIENSAGHLADKLIGGDAHDPFAVRRNCNWFCFEKFLFGHGDFPSLGTGESSLPAKRRFLGLAPFKRHYREFRCICLGSTHKKQA